MAIFWDYAPQPQQQVEAMFHDALAAEPLQEPQLTTQARLRAAASKSATDGATLKSGRLIIALIIVAILLGAGIGTDASNLTNSSKALFSLATTAFGIVVGLLTGEKPKS